MQLESVTGEIPARIDGKGRITIPAKVREAFQQGDPDWSAGLSPRMQVNYGDHLGPCLAIWTMAAHRENQRAITAMQPTTPEEEEAKEEADYYVLTQSQTFEIDREGRVVLPPRLRDKLGIVEGDLVFAGKGDRFDLWSEATYEVEVRAPMRARRAAKPKGWHPMTAVRAKGG